MDKKIVDDYAVATKRAKDFITNKNIVRKYRVNQADTRFFDMFAPGNHNNIYDNRFLLQFPNILSQIVVLHKLSVVKDKIRIELQDILKSESDIVPVLEDRKSEIRKILHGKKTLESMEYKVNTHPLSLLIDQVKQQGTMMDIIGVIQKLRYNKMDLYISDSWTETLDRYIADLIHAFDERYGKDAYLKIREAFDLDSVVLPKNYEYFMKELKIAIRNNVFENSRKIYNQEIQNIALSKQAS